MAAIPVPSWQLRTRILSLKCPVFMGIVNVTPDSFSDGGRWLEPAAAVDRAMQLVEAGAGILDIGGESTRPGSDGIDAETELRRIIPVITTIRDRLPAGKAVPISVDTVKAVVAEEAIRAGAEIVNDVSSCADPDMVRVLRETGAAYCLTHTRGTPKTMQNNPHYDHVVEEIFQFLKNRRFKLMESGVEPARIAVDPGLGFGKTTPQNWSLVESMERFHELGAPLLVGHSRKRFIAETFENREEGTRTVTRKLLEQKVQIIRLHDISGPDTLSGTDCISIQS